MRMKAVFLVVLFLAVTGAAQAFEQFANQNVVISQGTPIADDLLAAGNNVSVDADVTGNAFVAGGNVGVGGPVSGALAAAGGTVNISGTKQTVMAAGGTVNIRGITARNLALAGGTVNVDSGTRVARDLLLSAGEANMLGTVGRDLRIAGGNIRIGGKVNGDVYANGQSITLEPGAVVTGDLVYESPTRATIARSAKVLGDVRHTPMRKGAQQAGLGRLWRAIVGFAMMFLFGVVLVAVFPAWTAQAASNVLRLPGWSALWGVVSLIVTPLAVLIAFMTIVGVPLGLAVMFAYFIALMVAMVVAAVAIGAALLKGPSIWLQLLIGLLIIYILGSIPILGSLVRLAVLIFGLGGVVLAFKRTPARPAEAVPEPA
jgi:cytoskeletal protein CcmA (bactofilin family)